MEKTIISPKNSSLNNDFLSNYLDNIIEIYIYFKESLSPYFLQYLTNSVGLTQFVMNIINEKDNKTFKNDYINQLQFELFKNEFMDEILVSYKLVNNLLISNGKFLPKSSWELFCYNNSKYP